MARVTVRLPSLLAQVLGRKSELQLEADTLEDLLDAIRRDHPTLAQHIFDESHRIRQHVLCFLNDTNTRWIREHGTSLHDGDTLEILQAVSGG